MQERELKTRWTGKPDKRRYDMLRGLFELSAGKNQEEKFYEMLLSS